MVFFSRQSSTIPLDFTLLAKELETQSPETEIVYFCRKMRRKTNVFSYCLFILHSLYHLATASIAVTDTYSIQLCVLRPKRGQTVVQVWHAVGAVKQFSYQCLDKPGGQPGGAGTSHGDAQKLRLCVLHIGGYGGHLCPRVPDVQGADFAVGYAPCGLSAGG